MKRQIEVVAAVIKEGNKYFCAKRKDNGELARKWEFPGGKIEQGESHQEALIREIHEELETTINVNEFILTVTHEYNSFVLIMHAYYCSVINGELKLSEHLDSDWKTIEEMKNMDFAAADVPIINGLK